MRFLSLVLVGFSFIYTPFSFAEGDSLCTIYVSEVDGQHRHPIESAVEELKSDKECVDLAKAKLENHCVKKKRPSRSIAAVYTSFDTEKFDTKKGEIPADCPKL